MAIEGNIIGEIAADTRIYRIFPRNWFNELYNDCKNALVLPTKWEDPFENAILKAEVRKGNGEKGCFSFHEDVYGQCWTLEKASDAIWQVYSRGKDAVRLRTTVRKLLEGLSNAQGEWAGPTCFVGKVDYLSENKLRELGRALFKDGIDSERVARSLLAKRKAYKHENEVRLIYIERSGAKHNNGVFKYEVDPRSFIDQVMVDGRVSPEEFRSLKKEIISLTGLTDRQVKRSLLYSPPKGFVVEIA